MKALTAIALLLTLGAPALAKPAPVETATSALARNGVDINMGPAGAMLERAYFQAPQPPFNAGSFPCRLLPSLLDKTRLAQSCH